MRSLDFAPLVAWGGGCGGAGVWVVGLTSGRGVDLGFTDYRLEV